MKNREFKPIEEWIREFIRDRNLVVLRDRRGKALNVSYSIDGLKWTANKFGKLLYYKNCYLGHEEVSPGNWRPVFRGKMEKSPNVVVEKFVPRDHHNLGNQIAEYFWVQKAMKMLYHVPNEPEEMALVYKTA